MSVVSKAGAWLRRNPFRIYFVAIALAVVPLTLFVLGAHKVFIQQVTSRAIAGSAQQGHVVGAIMEQHLDEQKEFLQALAIRPDVVQDLQSRNYSHLTSTFDVVHQLHSELLGIAAVSADGLLLAVSPPPNTTPGIGANVSSRPWYGPVTSTWKPYISPIFRSPRAGNPWVAALAVPVLTQDGKPLAILVSSQTLQELTRPVYSLVPQTDTNSGAINFIDQQGQVFGRDGKGGTVAPLAADATAIQALMKDRPGAGRVLQMGGRKYIAEYSAIPSLGWGVLIQFPTAAVAPAVWVYEKNIAMLAGIIVLLAFGGGAVVAYLYKRLRDSEGLYLHHIEEQNRELELRNRTVEHANQLKTRFLATMSHELRTPLNAVLGFATLLTEDASIPLKQQRWAEHIREGGRHLLQLINDVLDLSKIEAGKLDLTREDFAVDAAVPEVTSTLSPLINAKKIRLKMALESGLRLDGDRVRFKQVLYNLLSNAVKFTPAGGEVRMGARREGASALFEVEDTGIGIRPEDQQAIFEEFHQGPSGFTNGSGTGLGLAITKRLIEQHGGRIWLRSEPNHGSCFSFTMPLAAVRAKDEERTSSVNSAPQPRPAQ